MVTFEVSSILNCFTLNVRDLHMAYSWQNIFLPSLVLLRLYFHLFYCESTTYYMFFNLSFTLNARDLRVAYSWMNIFLPSLVLLILYFHLFYCNSILLYILHLLLAIFLCVLGDDFNTLWLLKMCNGLKYMFMPFHSVVLSLFLLTVTFFHLLLKLVFNN